MNGEIHWWLSIAYTLTAALIVAVYWVRYGPANFLWFSDMALIVTAIALWTESPLLASMMAVGVLLPELAWNISFFGRLLFGVRLTGLADYMFQSERSLFLRALSLFHVALPVVLMFLLGHLGYDRRAWLAQSVVTLIVLPATWLLTKPEKNINWVFGPGSKPQRRLPPLLYLVLAMAAFPLLILMPTHLILAAIFDAPGERR